MMTRTLGWLRDFGCPLVLKNDMLRDSRNLLSVVAIAGLQSTVGRAAS